MIPVNGLEQELLDLGKVIGLVTQDNNLNSDWFKDPLDRIKTILSNEPQRDALLRLLDALFPPVPLPGLPVDEKWHPLLGDALPGNLYLTVKETGGGVQVGVGGDFGNPNGAGVSAGLRARLPLISAGASVSAIAGSANAPLEIVLTVHLGLQQSSGDPISLEAIVATASIAPPDASLTIELKQLALDGRPPQDTILDPKQLGSEATQLILGLLKQNLSKVTSGDGAEAVAVRDHLLALFGLDGASIPPLPVTRLFEGPAALQDWFKSLLQGATPPILAWLGHLGGLIGASGATVTGTGAPTDPWRSRVISFDSQGALSVTLAKDADSLLIGLEASFAPSVASPVARVEAQATMASIPLNGVANASVLPAASFTFRAPGDVGAPDLVSNADIKVKSLRGGLRWNGSSLQPALELEDVTLGTTHYDRLDLTHTDSVADAVSDLVQDKIRDALGSGPGSHFAALAGIIAPSADTDPSPPLVDSFALVSNPAREIARVHRERLINSKNNAVHDWKPMLAEIASLLGLGGSVSGAGTQDDPWRAQIGPAAAINIELAAWNAQTSNDPADPQLLRLGLRASASSPPLQFSWLAELLAFDLPQSAAGSVGLMAGQHAGLLIEPGLTTPPVAGISIHAGSVRARMDWAPGSSIAWQASVNDLAVTVNGTTVSIPALRFPPAIGFDVSNPAGTAASLGVSIPDLELLLRALIAKAALSWGGMRGFTLAGLLGAHKGLPGFQIDWPTLADPSGSGSLLNNPFDALRLWLNHVSIDLSGDGSPFLLPALDWLRAFLGNSLPSAPSINLPQSPIKGSGTYEDPWALPLVTGSQSAEALAWLEPEGPPSNWAGILASRASEATDFRALLEVARALAAFLPGVADAVGSIDPDAMASAIESLDNHLKTSDGVAPLASQVPTASNWTAGTTIHSPHHLQPKDPAAITQILAQIDAWAGGATGARAVLLLGPAFSDHTIWQDLLVHPDRHGATNPAAHFNLRAPGVNPDAIDLDTVTVVADYYTADLQDGIGDIPALVNQIGRVVARIGALRPGAQVTIVAHSTAGVFARAFTAANPSLVRGLITLGSPHGGAPLPFLTDAAVADALRFVQGLRVGMTAPGPLRDALDHLFRALDGYIPAAAAGELPALASYPAGSFAGTLSSDTGGRPALAIGGALDAGLLDLLKQAAGDLATQATTGARPTPTHLAFGARAWLGLPTAEPGDVRVDAALRADAFRIRLRDGVADPPRPPHALGVEVKLSRPGGWLVGAASAFAGIDQPLLDVRVREAEFGIVIEAEDEGRVKVTPRLALHQASLRGPMLQRVDLRERAAEAQALLGAVMQAITNPTPAATTPVSALVNALQSLGVAAPDPHGGFGVSADAFAAIVSDAASFFRPRLQPALDAAGGLTGLSGPPGGPWTFALTGLPLEIYLSRENTGVWRPGLRTTPAGAGALSLGGDASLSFDANLALPDFAPSLDATFRIGALSLSYAQSSRKLTLEAPPCLEPITLLPAPAPSELAAKLNDLLPRVIFSSSAGAMIESLVGPDIRVGPLDCFLAATGDFLRRPSSLGRADGAGFDASKLTALLQTINRLAGFADGEGLQLPAEFQLTVTGPDPVKVNLATTAPIGGVLGAQLSASIDRQLHVSPGGTLTLTTPLNSVDWPAVTVTFGVDASGVSLVVAPQGVTPIQILPEFSGLGALRGALDALLPDALDRLVSALSAPGPQPTWLMRLLAVAEALGLYDGAGKFKAHADDLRALLRGDWPSLFDPTQRANAAMKAADLINSVVTLPTPATASGSAVNVSFTLGGADAGTIGLSLGWDGSGPLANLTVTGVKLGDGAIRTNVAAGYAAGAIQCSADLAVSLQDAVGLDITPKLAVSFTSGGAVNRFNLNLLPLATSGSDGPLRIELAPSPGVQADPSAPQQIVERWLSPLAIELVFDAVKSKLADPIWAGGPALRDALAHAELVVKGATPADDQLKTPLPDVQKMVRGFITGLAAGSGVSVVIEDLTVSMVEDGGKFGVRLKGRKDFNAGRFGLSARFGGPSEWATETPKADQGVALYLFRSSGAGSFDFRPELFVAGLGLGLSGAGGSPLIDNSGFRMGAARVYSFFVAEFAGGLTVNSLGGGLELDDLGLPLDLATRGNLGGNNPVAENLLKSGGGSTGGDPQPVNPGVDISAWFWSAPAGDDEFHILFGGQTGTLWISVHRGFGPIYIEQVGLDVSNAAVAMLIDGSVKVDGLAVQADDLTILVPYKYVLNPEQWTLDLRGLAVGFRAPGVVIAGGLIKNDGPPVEYAGMLLVQLTKFGIVAVGAYSTPTDTLTGETYTSLFVFAGVFIPIGIPPIIEISGLGLGVGYNRQLIPPEDLNQVPNFVLVSVLDEGGAIANNPMGALRRISDQMPAKRGSFWLAVGLRGVSFELVHVTAVVYIALDRGVEVGLIGLARMALPPDGTAIVNIEMALKARFSAEEGIFSVQGQLTDNSWLISPDCQLTGGFAYFAWFKRSQFLVTIGGYHPSFRKPPEFPDVPRIGYHWVFAGVVNLKGEAYFALTNTCVMLGTRVEATYGPDWIQAWFSADVNVLVSWDPFHYDFTFHVEVGARFRIKICFFKCVRISISVSVGADLHIEGPPFHGEVTVDLAIGSVTIPFGPDPAPVPQKLLWTEFMQKYLQAGDPVETAVTVYALEGLLMPEPPGGQPAPGTQSQPWKMAAEFTFQTETRMPATKHEDFVSGKVGPDVSKHLARIDIAPMRVEQATSEHIITLEAKDNGVWRLMTRTETDDEFRIDVSRFRVERITGQVSEATYHYLEPDEIPAAANTLPVITGVKITGFAALQGKSAKIPFGRLVEYGNSRPLPFATLTVDVITGLKDFGLTAEVLGLITASATSAQTIAASQRLLSGGGFFSEARVAAGLPAGGLTPVASRSLERYRTAPPLITPITTGLTMKPVGQPAPPVINEFKPSLPVTLGNPRLRAVLQSQPLPTVDSRPAPRTSVTRIIQTTTAAPAPPIENIPRMAAPKLATGAGAHLEFVRAANAPRPTSLPSSGRTLRNIELGWSAGGAHMAAFSQAEKDVIGEGVGLVAGATHVWELPQRPGLAVQVNGEAGVRVTCLTRGGRIISDREERAHRGELISLPEGCGMVAVTCLGRVEPRPNERGGFGAVSFSASPQGKLTVAGWQTGSLLQQIGSTALLGRGAALALPQPVVAVKGRQRTSQAMVRVSDAMVNQPGVETWLPPTVGVVGVILDQQDTCAASEGDFSIAVTGATLRTPPLRVEGGRRKLLLYNVVGVERGADYIVVAVASREGSRFAGVIGLPGRAQEWAARMNGGAPEQLVPDGTLTPDGQVNVRILTVETEGVRVASDNTLKE